MIEMEPIEMIQMKEELKQREQNIAQAGVTAAEAKVIVGYELKQIRDKKLYICEGYKNMDEYARAVFGMDHTANNRAMGFNDKYSVGGNSRELDERFKGFKPSLLQEMLSLKQEGDFEIITANTNHLDVRALVAAEAEQEKEEKKAAEQIQGQESLMSLMPDVVPDSDKLKKPELTIKDVLRELFHPREMKERLDILVNMDPDSSTLDWWVDDFKQAVRGCYKKPPFFLFLYSLSEGVKIKNVKEKTIEAYTYKDFYFMVRAAFGQETVRGTDVWNQAFGAEYEAELQRQKEEEQRQQEEEKRKKELQKQKEEKQRQVKENQEKLVKSEEKKPEKEIMEQPEEEKTAVFNKINENSDFDNNLKGNETEKPEVVTGIVEDNPQITSQKEENFVCDIAQDWEYITKKEVSRNTYKETVSGKRRHLVSELVLTEGSRLKLTAMGEEKEIRVTITIVDEIIGSAFNVYGFEVMGCGEKE